MTDKLLLGTLSAVFSGVMTVAVVGGVVMWKDVAVMKEQIALNKVELDIRARSADQFEVFLTQMDKSIAIQTESVNGLKKAVERLEQTVYSFKEVPFDRRD